MCGLWISLVVFPQTYHSPTIWWCLTKASTCIVILPVINDPYHTHSVSLLHFAQGCEVSDIKQEISIIVKPCGSSMGL